MEKQFILRLPDCLKSADPKDIKLVKLGNREVSFNHRNISYPGLIFKLPTIVESQKIVENKLYKISDISTLVVIYENKNFNVEEEVFKYESSGLTPPMAYVKERRFVRNSARCEEVEKIEKKVAALVAEDLKALKVEIINHEKESTSTDLDMFAAELENELAGSLQSEGKKAVSMPDFSIDSNEYSNRQVSVPKTPAVENSLKSQPEKADLKGKATPEITISNPTSAIENKGMDSLSISSSETPSIKIPSIVQKVELSSSTADLDGFSASPIIPAVQPTPTPQMVQEAVNTPTAVQKPAISAELQELETKIREKQDQFDKAVNPIIKKRFEQALNVLKAEYEKLTKDK